MNTSMYNGTTGILTYQEALAVESNNAANVNTVAFKADKISFADMMYQKGIGTGVSSMSIYKDHNQGGLKQTQSEYDFAIKGEGYFTIADPADISEVYYTRSGNFKLSPDGLLSTVDGFNVLGMQPVVTGDKITKEFTNYIATGVIVEDDDTIKTVNVFSSNYSKNAVDTGTSGTNYKKSHTNINDIEYLSDKYYEEIKLYGTEPTAGDDVNYQKSEIDIDKSLGDNKEFELSVTINGRTINQSFDENVENTLILFADKISESTGITASVDTASGKITIDSLIAGEKFIINNASANKQTMSTTKVQEATGSGEKLVNALYSKLEELIVAQGGKMAKNESEVIKPTNDNLQLGTLQLNMDTLGINENIFGELIVEDKNIFLKSGEGKYIVGVVTPMVFSNNQGLSPQGTNKYKSTEHSGEPIYIAEKNIVENKLLEISTSDLSKTLVNLMVYQKAFDANSKSITTSDELLKTALQLKTK